MQARHSRLTVPMGGPALRNATQHASGPSESPTRSGPGASREPGVAGGVKE